jgi:hypothetical protein
VIYVAVTLYLLAGLSLSAALRLYHLATGRRTRWYHVVNMTLLWCVLVPVALALSRRS